MKILRLTLKKKWFDMIASGEKKEEYREIKPYWINRLANKTFTHVLFLNGYSNKSPKILKPLISITISEGNPNWGAEIGIEYFVLKFEN